MDKSLRALQVLRVTEPEQTYTFVDVPEDVVPSLLREFSAPVKLTVPQRTDADLQFLMVHDTDEFCRWEAGQEYAQKVFYYSRTRHPGPFVRKA